jgi:hypothetical protein
MYIFIKRELTLRSLADMLMPLSSTPPLIYTFSNEQIHKLLIILFIMNKPRDQCLNGNKLNKVWANAMVTET